ncbi:MAG: hypothetical protein UY08_C0006G0015 [Candidatus Gottesmanbacteria bacterium GW2011_GWA1_47_8]|uniref:Uncharacterized protein n=1 Tax=Candidatus Gottesmanbacteria bacterium GW2011_GWA1_47_8 TaxID=1618438 RepID=A0A0G1TGL4_9BACT|nr:MAG: hypothetical protein UY08_C0006G0015 [Candidatus Gottesmanbacteria bacterium GW2011_GWA1_47_8]
MVHLPYCRGAGIGRQASLKNLCSSPDVRVRVSPAALSKHQVGGLEKMLSLPAVLRPSRGSGALVQLRADLEIYQKRGMDVSYATELIGRF